MKSVAIVEAFHPIHDIDSPVLPGGISLPVHAFDFERLEEAFSHGIIPTIGLATHGCRHGVVADQVEIFLTGILAPTTGVHN